MKRTISFVLAIIMLFSVITSADLSASAEEIKKGVAEVTTSLNDAVGSVASALGDATESANEEIQDAVKSTTVQEESAEKDTSSSTIKNSAEDKATKTVQQSAGNVSTSETANPASDFNYTTSNNKVAITKYKGTATTVFIPSIINGNPVTSIGNYAFEYCSGLTSITIPNSVTSIGWRAFYGCSSLTEMTLPFTGSSSSATTDSRYTHFGYIFGYSSSSSSSSGYHYYGYGPESSSIKYYYTYNIPTSLKKVTFTGDKVLPYAFQNCSRLTSITIGDSVTSIGYYAFKDCSSLTSITIGNSVTSIGNDAFKFCSSLTSVTIPNSVTSIGYSAFEYCSSLASITIPNSVTSIGDEAFYGTAYYNKQANWANGALYINNNLIKVNDTTTYIIRNNTKIIADMAFYECSSLTSITIPNSVTSIGSSAFSGCSSLTKTNYTGTVDQWAEISFGDAYANPVYYSKNLYINGNQVTKIELESAKKVNSFAFYKCSSLTSITIPNSVTSIGDSAFEYCSSLTSITIPDSVTSIGNRTFEYCSGLTSITIPDSVTNIGYSAFSGCSGSTSITIGDSVTSIGDSAFYNCSGLTSVTIPDSVTSISSSVFSGCSSLTSIIVDEKNTVYDSRNNCNAIIETATNTLVGGCKNTVIPDSVTSIGNYAFSYCNCMTSITIPDSVTSISSYAFSGCSGLTSITIPDSVTIIGESAFGGCSSLTEIALPFTGSSANATEKIGYTHFGYIFGCSSSSSYISGYHYYSNGIYYKYNIPTSLKKVTITGNKVLPCAFLRCNNLTNITIPNSVTSIGYSAFEYCCSLESVSIPDSITEIGNSAFSWCINLVNIRIPSKVTIIRRNTFYHCDSLSRIYIPNGVEDIDGYAFAYCSSLKDVVIPNGVWNIGDYSFFYCENLQSITIPSSVINIREYAFSYCRNLKKTNYLGTIDQWAGLKFSFFDEADFNINVTNPTYYSKDLYINGKLLVYAKFENIKTINAYAFDNCRSLKSITIPYSVRKVGNSAFSNCESIKYVFYMGNNKEWNHISFGSDNDDLLYAKMHFNSSNHNSSKIKITKATTSKSGSIVKTCSVCGEQIKSTIYYPKTFKLSTTTYTYDGKTKTPSVSVYGSNGKKISSSNYSVSYASGRKYVGKYAVKVTFKGSYYSGSKTVYFNINPKGTKISSLSKPAKGQLKVNFSKQTSQTTGYQIQYCKSKTFKSGVKTITLKNSYNSYTVKGLPRNTGYYFRIRTYKTVGKTHLYSGWSAYKGAKTK